LTDPNEGDKTQAVRRLEVRARRDNASAQSMNFL